MNTLKKSLSVALMLVAAAATAQTSQGGGDAGHRPEAAAPSSADSAMADGEVRKVDKEAKKLTLRHGPIPNLEMPEMTMVFRVADPKMLDGLAPKQKVRFAAARIEGRLTVTSLEVVR